MTEDKQQIGELNMNEIEDYVLAVLENAVLVYNLIYQTRNISDKLPLYLGHMIDDHFIEIEDRKFIFNALPMFDKGLILHVLTTYLESNIIGDEVEIESKMKTFNTDTPQWTKEDTLPEGIRIDTNPEEE